MGLLSTHRIQNGQGLTVSAPSRRAGRKRRAIYAVYVACLFCLVAAGGHAWREWRFERRGVERPRQTDSGQDVERRPGINVELTQYDAQELDRALSDIASLGFYWVRQRFSWQAIEPQPGLYDWSPGDALVAAVDSHHLGLIAVLDTFPAWAKTGAAQDEPVLPLPCTPPCDRDAYARFVSEFAARYASVTDYYQVWDEPNLSRSWGGGHVHPCGYATLLEAAYPAIHAADPTAWVLGGGLAPTQAAGPDNLNDLTYLQGLYAAGGGSYFDVLAARAYGFWSGPQDRRVQPDVLNFSRVVAQREVMRTWGEAEKPVWAVGWGWNVLPPGWEGDPSSWGSDELRRQEPRILDAVTRARSEWPWLDVMCWAAYQPDAPPTSPQWGFALRASDGSRTELWSVLRLATERSTATLPRPAALPARWGTWVVLFAAAGVDAFALWRRLGCTDAVRRAWGRWALLPPAVHLAALLGLAVLYALTPAPEWIVLELACAAAVLYLYPAWALLGAVFAIPFFYFAKPVGELQVPPAETLLWLVFVVTLVRAFRGKRSSVAAVSRAWRALIERASLLDLAWVLWIGAGTLALLVAPDPALGQHEWRLCVVDPALLYLILRLQGGRASRTTPGSEKEKELFSWLLLAWIASGVVVALVGIVQWGTGVLIGAGEVGRVTGVYYSPNHVALYLERIWPLALVLAIEGRWRWRRETWAAVALLGAGMYLTYSRGAWLLAVPAAALVLGIVYRRRLRWWMAGGGATAMALLATVVLQGRQTPLAALSEEVRIPVWQSTLEMIGDHLWRGVGLDGFRFVYPRYMRAAAWTEPLLYHPHNAWLDVTVRLGLPGLAVYCLLLAGVACSAASLLRGMHSGNARGGLYQAVAVGCLSSLLAALAHGLVDSGYFLADLAWSLALVAGLLACAGRLYRGWGSGTRGLEIANDVEA
jgi:O-antigen ligase